MLELTSSEQKQFKDTLIRFGITEDPSVADKLVRLTNQENARNLYHATEVFLNHLPTYISTAKVAKEEHEEDQYSYALEALSHYERVMKVLDKTYSLNAKIIRERYEKKRTAKEIYEELHMGKTAYFKNLKKSIGYFSVVLWGAPSKDIDMALSLLRAGGDG
ncbi:MAG TPA: hypothetical protein DEO39_05345 [Clostridiales bacterium]|nr:hypothetical protein [Clostridiales bacterium]